jgi:hypothetical protein
MYLIMISDSPSSQCRNRYTIFLVSLLCQQRSIKDFEWIYSESGLGKGAPDGVGAALKRMADSHVSRGNSVLNANDFLIVGRQSKILLKMVSKSLQHLINKQNLSNQNVCFQVSTVEIDRFADLLAQEHVPPMKGIGKAHNVYILCYRRDCTMPSTSLPLWRRGDVQLFLSAVLQV